MHLHIYLLLAWIIGLCRWCVCICLGFIHVCWEWGWGCVGWSFVFNTQSSPWGHIRGSLLGAKMGVIIITWCYAQLTIVVISGRVKMGVGGCKWHVMMRIDSCVLSVWCLWQVASAHSFLLVYIAVFVFSIHSQRQVSCAVPYWMCWAVYTTRTLPTTSF